MYQVARVEAACRNIERPILNQEVNNATGQSRQDGAEVTSEFPLGNEYRAQQVG